MTLLKHFAPEQISLTNRVKILPTDGKLQVSRGGSTYTITHHGAQLLMLKCSEVARLWCSKLKSVSNVPSSCWTWGQQTGPLLMRQHVDALESSLRLDTGARSQDKYCNRRPHRVLQDSVGGPLPKRGYKDSTTNTDPGCVWR